MMTFYGKDESSKINHTVKLTPEAYNKTFDLDAKIDVIKETYRRSTDQYKQELACSNDATRQALGNILLGKNVDKISEELIEEIYQTAKIVQFFSNYPVLSIIISLTIIVLIFLFLFLIIRAIFGLVGFLFGGSSNIQQTVVLTRNQI